MYLDKIKLKLIKLKYKWNVTYLEKMKYKRNELYAQIKM